MTSNINVNGTQIVKSYEGLRLNSYKCEAGIWTIGYGHTRDVKSKQTITQEEADELLQQDLSSAKSAVNNYVNVPLTDNQYGALMSLAYNIGSTAFKNSTLVKKINKKDYSGASNEILRWNKVNRKVSTGLTKRRKEEKRLFDTSDNEQFIVNGP